MIFNTSKPLILLMIIALFYISVNLTFAGQTELDSKVSFTVQ
jgi:hypothetical protein